jgi:hypothetical protein
MDDLPNFFESIKDILASIGKDDLVADKDLQQVVEESIEACILSISLSLSPSSPLLCPINNFGFCYVPLWRRDSIPNDMYPSSLVHSVILYAIWEKMV